MLLKNHDLNSNYIQFQVVIASLNQSVGMATAHQLQDKYGKDSIFYTSCDVTQQQQMEGELFFELP